MIEPTANRPHISITFMLIFAAAAVLITGLATHAATTAANIQEVVQAKTVKAEKFLLVDKDGTEWIRMTASEDGDMAGITFRDKKKARGGILLTESKSTLTLKAGKDSNAEVFLTASEDDVMLVCNDEKGHSRGAIIVHRTGMAIHFFDSKGVVRGEMNFIEDGTGGLKLFDGGGKVVWKAPP